MSSEAFRRLSSILEERGLLQLTVNLNVDEQLFIFLTILCQNQTNREAQDHEQCLGSTVSEYFTKVLEAVFQLKVDFIRHPDFTAVDPHIIAGGNKYSPWFDDCVRALDGMHVPCVSPRETAELYRNRKGYFSLNVLTVCSFDLRFTYMLSGWEGSAHDARVLASALDHPRKRFSILPPGKFYLVDSGYANNGCFMAPYRGTTYHLQELLDQYSQDGVPVADIDPYNVEEDINDNNNHEGQPLNNEPELEMNALRDARAHTMWAVYHNRRTG
ncbi:uncharacterized protein LOC112091129 [Morus notabilis]|uniref:uncharacterized protein LOC112091129 n=1 Tax=Morus notabilis TaxID=981085 RepID=UPI000CECFED6|nr:uncharacterized protein LOC112091129 [Morus notabilis]